MSSSGGRRAALTLAAGLLLAACQQAVPAGPGTAPSADALSAPDSAPGSQGAGGQGADTGGSDPASDLSGPNGAEPAPSTVTGDGAGTDGMAASESTPGIRAALAHGCVAAGGEQTVTVTSTPGFQVTVNAQYADGQMGNIHGGLAFAQTIGEDGTFVHAWRVSVDAPAGEVIVHAGAQSTTEQSDPVTTSVTFRVAEDC